MSCTKRKAVFLLCENKGAGKLRSYCAADQCLCFHFIGSTFHLLANSEILSCCPAPVAVQLGLYLTWSGTPKTGFLVSHQRQVFWCRGSNYTISSVGCFVVLLAIKVTKPRFCIDEDWRVFLFVL